jgi:hypothetical protein
LLAKPFRVREPAIGILTTEADIENDRRKIETELRDAIFSRIAALFRHYSIDDRDELGAWKLAFALAYAHVPGFKKQQGRARRVGAPRTWTPARYMELYAAVSRKIAAGASISRACYHLRKEPAYRGMSAATLERRYHMALTDSGMIGRLLATSISDGAPVDDWVWAASGIGAGKPAG